MAPVVALLLPVPLEGFVMREQAQDLLGSPGVVAVAPPRLPYGAVGRLPGPLARAVAAVQVRRLELAGDPSAVVIYHPLQLPLAQALAARHAPCELWYGRWDRYEAAPDAGPLTRRRLRALHARAAASAALTFVASEALGARERAAGGPVVLSTPPADSFPAPDPGAAVIAVSLGHLGRRTDWALLRALSEAMPELVLLLVGERHDGEAGHDPDFQACLRAPNLVWLGRRSDEEAARLILCADVGIVPFRVDPFNDAALPYRILKYARLGRRTVAPELAGVRTWARAVTTAGDLDAWVAALRAQAGARSRPDGELRAWALAQTAASQNAPLRRRMQALGVGRPGQPHAATAEKR